MKAISYYSATPIYVLYNLMQDNRCCYNIITENREEKEEAKRFGHEDDRRSGKFLAC